MTTTMNIARRTGLAAGMLAIGALALPSLAAAQGVRADARWQGWLGCWQPVTATSADSYTAWMEQRARDAGAPTLCIVPSTSATAVDFVTIAGGKVATRETVDAGDTHRARQRDGCDGWEGAQWSDNARRVYLKSEYDCAGGVTRTSSGMLAMSGNGELLEIESVGSGGTKSVHVARYRSVAAPEGFALDSALVPRADAIPVTAARAAAAGALTGNDIVDAVTHADSLVVEAWMLERGDQFTVNAKQLAALADAGVPGRITDLLVALAYPKVFALKQPTVAMTPPPAATGSALYVTVPPASPYGYGYNPFGYSPYGYSPYGYDDYAYRYGYNGYSYGYLYQPPIVIVRAGAGGTARPHGHVVNGQGYTRDPSPANEPSTSRRGSSGSSGSSSSGSTSSSGSSSSSSSSSGSGETRHAKPRP